MNPQDPNTGWKNISFLRKYLPNTSRKFGDKPAIDEVGVAGESLLGVYPDAEARTDKFKADDYIKMRQKDGTIASVYNVLTLPILATTYSFEPDDEDTNGEQCDFIKSALFDPPHKGGMEIPFQLTLADMLRALLEGFRVFERVYMVREDGKVGYKKLGPLDARTVYLIRSDDSTYGGLHQRTSFKAHYIDVYLPPEKTFLFTYNKAHNFLYGESAFKPAAYHYEIKHKLYYLANLSAQVSAIPPMVISGPQNTEEPAKRRLLRAAERLGLKTVLYKPDQFEVAPYDTGKGRLDIVPIIDHHDSQIYRSVLAQFIMLGQSSGDVGSWALSESHESVFELALKAVMNVIEEHINFYLVPDLIDMNFAEPHYPTFKFENTAPDAQALVHDAFIQLTSSGQLSDLLKKAIENEVVDKLQIDKEQLEKEMLEDDKTEGKRLEQMPEVVKAKSSILTGLPQEQNPDDPAVASGQTMPGQSNQPPAKSQAPSTTTTKKAPAQSQKKNLSRNTKRTPTSHEQRVDMAGIERHMDASEAQFVKDAQPIVMAMKDDAIKRVEHLLGDVANIRALDGLTLGQTAPLRSLMLRYIRQSYEYGKKTTSDELNAGSPATSRPSAALLTQHANTAYEKLIHDLMFGIKAAALSAGRKQQLARTDLSVADVLQSISMLFGAFQQNKMAQTAAVLVSTGLSLARRDVFLGQHDNIAAYQWSALIDQNTCPVCLSLDGTVVDYAEYLTTPWQPPVHVNCRCIWVAIMSDQVDIPDFTGMPDAPGGKTEPDL